jgi:Zn-dependent peptidase ImmA (M78 family)
MPTSWSINLEWETLDSGTPEERACFASTSIRAHNQWLTEGLDSLTNSIRKAPRLSAYHLSEWIAWNWWRLRWEPRSTVVRDWSSSHRLSTIGGGYIWPNITVFSDGERIALIASPTGERPQTPFRYLADGAAIIQATEFEAGIDSFTDQVMERLSVKQIEKTNLHAIWQSVLDERSTPSIARARKLEALSGHDPDEFDPSVVKQLIIDSDALGADAVDEIAADRAKAGAIPTARELRDIAATSGYDTTSRDFVRLAGGSGLPSLGQVPAWRLGAAAANALREQERLDSRPLSNDRLASMAGIQANVLTDKKSGNKISFALYENNTKPGRIVFRSKWQTGRRFELARILGDRIARQQSSRLSPATRSYTYRQKLQRSFAAEFLSPFEFVDEMLAGDYSMESQQEAAEYFDVSPMTIRTLLVNHKRIERDTLDFDTSADELFAGQSS